MPNLPIDFDTPKGASYGTSFAPKPFGLVVIYWQHG
jgi:hypothetical protein